jgi:hypothetical protein
MKRASRAIWMGIAVAALAVTSYASPYWTLRQMRNAIVDKDADAFSSHVDFPALRESVRAQVMVAMQAKLGVPETKGNALAGLGMLLGMALMNQIIDTIVTPSGVMALMAEGTARPLDLIPGRTTPAPGASAPPTQPKPSARASETAPSLAPPPSPSGTGSEGAAQSADAQTDAAPENDYSVQYKNWSTFTATARHDGQAPVSFLFRRDGLWSWKLAGVTLPVNPAR